MTMYSTVAQNEHKFMSLPKDVLLITHNQRDRKGEGQKLFTLLIQTRAPHAVANPRLNPRAPHANANPRQQVLDFQSKFEVEREPYSVKNTLIVTCPCIMGYIFDR